MVFEDANGSLLGENVIQGFDNCQRSTKFDYLCPIFLKSHVLTDMLILCCKCDVTFLVKTQLYTALCIQKHMSHITSSRLQSIYSSSSLATSPHP